MAAAMDMTNNNGDASEEQNLREMILI